MNPCVNNPCFYGQCVIVTPSAWACVCDPGWTGRDCQEPVNECLSNPCANAAVCQDDLNKYHCHCRTGFTGTHCEITTDRCSNIPCQNNGKIADRSWTRLFSWLGCFRDLCQPDRLSFMFVSSWLDWSVLRSEHQRMFQSLIVPSECHLYRPPGHLSVHLSTLAHRSELSHSDRSMQHLQVFERRCVCQ